MRSRLFISYSHEDKKWLQRVREHLSVLESAGLLDAFEDSRIGVGEDWHARLHQEMKEARIALLLVSATFLTSDFIGKEEVPALMSAHVREGMVIYPLLVRDCAWQQVSWLSRLQMRPGESRALASMRGATLDTCLADVAREIATIVKTPDIETPSGRKQVYREFDEKLSNAPPVDQLRAREFFTRKSLKSYHLTIPGLKSRLRQLDYYKGDMDDSFDQALAGAIVLFQKDHHLDPVDGICGEMTLKMLADLTGALTPTESHVVKTQEATRAPEPGSRPVEAAVPLDRRAVAITMVHETGKPRSYTAVYTMGNDLSYGQCWASLKQGSLSELLKAYCEIEGARFKAPLAEYQTRLESKDETLAEDERFKGLLTRIAGEDPAMVRVQDELLERRFLGPARQECADIGVKTALGFALIADSFFSHGRNRYERIKLATIRALDGTPVTGVDERSWLRRYAAEQIASASNRGFAGAVEGRTQTYLHLMESSNWDLTAPVPIRGYRLVDP